MISRLSPLVMFLALGGCGLKGPLYLPEERAQEVSRQSSEQQKKNRTTSPAPGEAQPPAVPTDTTPAPTPPRH